MGETSMSISLADPTTMKVLIDARIEQLRGSRPRPASSRIIPRRN